MDRFVRIASGMYRELIRAAVAGVALIALGACGHGGEAPQCSFFSNKCEPTGPFNYTPPPSVFVTPAKITLEAGSTVTFTAFVADLQNPGYQWQRSSDRGLSYVDIPGATGAGYSQIVGTADSGALFRVNVRGTGGVQLGAGGEIMVSPLPPVAFQDSEFAQENWRVTVIATPTQNGPANSVEQQAIGGNPGAFRAMVHTMPAGPSSLRVAHVSQVTTYDPAVQGAILSIDYAEDCRLSDRSYQTLFLRWNFVVEQAGRRFRRGLYRDCDSSGWSRAALSSLVVADFEQLDGPACGVGEACPDFSAAGKPLRFGFERRTFTSDGLPAGSVTHGIDNWRVAVWRK